MFKIKKKDPGSEARLGVLETSRGKIQTPAFMPVGTNATVKTLSSEELMSMDARVILVNAYHLYLRPGLTTIELASDLHKFMGWDAPILTDSGGYQIFSLAQLRRLNQDGVEFQSHFDGSTHFFAPETVMAIQKTLGSDLIMPLDVCAAYPCERKDAEWSVEKTSLWARRSIEFYRQRLDPEKQMLFGIIQGATFKDLRRQSAEEIIHCDFKGYAVGGVSVGEPEAFIFETLHWLKDLLPHNRPRYLMGVGLPDQMVRAAGCGIDLFDTVIPTRYGRNGSAFTHQGKVTVRNAEFTQSQKPIDEACGCFVCQKYTRSYLRHLINSKEILGLRLLVYHNVYFYLKLMKDVRKAIAENRFKEFEKEFLLSYSSAL